jgi:hypothetical protein
MMTLKAELEAIAGELSVADSPDDLEKIVDHLLDLARRVGDALGV